MLLTNINMLAKKIPHQYPHADLQNFINIHMLAYKTSSISTCWPTKPHQYPHAGLKIPHQ
jgi:hypothetical protein